MTKPKIAKTWEECARHVEAGGVVEYLDYQGDDEWMQGGMTAVDYRGMAEAPGKRGWRPRRLLPIEDANPGPVTAATWEECARHVEAGGVVEYLSNDGVWMEDGMTAVDYLEWTGTPGKRGWRPRRLLPIEAPIDASMTPDVPEGCEIVYIPTETIDYLHSSWCESVYDDGPWYRLSLAICDTVARRPGEKVHWSEALGRKDMNGDLITKVTNEDLDRPQVLYYSNNAWHWVPDDGLIDVLVKDGES